MTKLFFFTALLFLLGCNNASQPATEKTEAKTPEAKVELPFKTAYEGTPSIGKTENIATVMHFNSDFIDGKLDSIGAYFADSVHAIFEDGREINTVRDSIAAEIKAWRGSMTGAKQSYIAAVAVDNKDKGHEWVFQWIDESHDYKDGKKEHFVFHEDYRLENGKIREFFQYAQGVPAKK